MRYLLTLKQPFILVQRAIFVLISIGLFYLSMPGGDFSWLTWLVLVPVFLACHQLKPIHAAQTFYFFMVGVFLVAIGWILPSIIIFTGLNKYLGFLILIVFCFVLSLPYGIAAWLVSYKNFFNKKYSALTVSIFFTVLISIFPTSLPGNFAHSLYQYPAMIQLVSVGGIPLLLFLVIMVNVLITQSIVFLGENNRYALTLFLQALFTLVTVYVFGLWHIENTQQNQKISNVLSIGFVQPLLQREDSIERLYQLSQDLVNENPDIDLLVWPEIPTRFSYAANRADRAKVNNLIAKLNKPMLIVSGAVYPNGVNKHDAQAEYFNAAHLISENRKLIATYSKQVLVPFFEYLPAEKDFPFIRELFPKAYRYIPGTQETLFPLNDDIKIIPLICYETIFPEIVQRFINKGGNLMINLSNDMWLGDGNASNYHFAVGMFRSVENGLPWVRITNSGISGNIRSSGDIISSSLTELQSIDAQVYKVLVPENKSFYARNGNIFLYIIFILFGVILLYGLGLNVYKNTLNRK